MTNGLPEQLSFMHRTWALISLPAMMTCATPQSHWASVPGSNSSGINISANVGLSLATCSRTVRSAPVKPHSLTSLAYMRWAVCLCFAGRLLSTSSHVLIVSRYGPITKLGLSAARRYCGTEASAIAFLIVFRECPSSLAICRTLCRLIKYSILIVSFCST